MRWRPAIGARHWNFYLALGAGIVVLLATLWLLPDIAAILGATVFSLVYLGLTLRDLPRLTPDYLRRHAGDEDAPPFVVFVLTLAIVIYVVVALFLVINGGTSTSPLRLILGIVSVALAWLMITVMWAMHYAWEYYEAPEEGGDGEQRGGLDFPGNELPDGAAFVYFSLVVTMTNQTSDTNITDNRMRRIVSAQSIFGYFFTTVAMAAAVNVVVSLGRGG